MNKILNSIEEDIKQDIPKFRAGDSVSDALAFGGTTPPLTAITESYNGISWTEVHQAS